MRFVIEKPHLYLVMFGKVRPGNRSNRASEAEALLREKLDKAAKAGHLNVPPSDAVRSILAANIGVTLMLISEPEGERNFELSGMTRDAVTTAVSSAAGDRGLRDPRWRPPRSPWQPSCCTRRWSPPTRSNSPTPR